MKLSKTGIKVLAAQYRAVLRKCLLINMGLFFCAAGAMAADAVSMNGGTKDINGDTTTAYKFSGWQVNLGDSEFAGLDSIDTSKSVDGIAADLKKIENIHYTNLAGKPDMVSKVELSNQAVLNLKNARLMIDPNQTDASINVISVKDSTINLKNSSLDASTDEGNQIFNTVFDHATLNLVSSELPIDGDVSFKNGSTLSISAPNYFSEEEIIAMLKNDGNAQKIAEAIHGKNVISMGTDSEGKEHKFLALPSGVELAYTNSDGTSGMINTADMSGEQMLEVMCLTIDDSNFIIGGAEKNSNDNDRARVSSDSQIIIQNNSNVVLNNRAVLTFDESDEEDDESPFGPSTLVIDNSHVTLNDNSQLSVANRGNALTEIKNHSQIDMNDNSQMNLNAVNLSDSLINMRDKAVLTMDSVTIKNAAINATKDNSIIIAGNNATTTFNDTTLVGAKAEGNLVTVQAGNKFVIGAIGKAVTIGDDKDTSKTAIYLTAEGDKKASTDINAENNNTITINGGILSNNGDNVVNFSGIVNFNGLFDPITANINDGITTRNGYDDDIAWSLNGGTLKYADDKYLYDSAKHSGEYALNSINFNGGTLDIANGKASEIKLAKLNLTADSNITLDADLANKTMDRFSDDTTVEGPAKLSISKLNLVSDAAEEETKINFTEKAELLAATNYTGATSGLRALSPIYSYDVAYDKNTGDFTFTRGSGNSVSDYNPAVYATSAVGHTTGFMQYNIANTAFNNLATSKIANKEGLASGDMPKANNTWVSVIGFDDNVDFDSFQSVDSQMMSVIGGVTSDVQQTALGKTTYGIYAGYMNGELEYDGNKINQEGGYLGLGTRIENGNMIAQSVINGGFIQNEDKHSFGTDKFDTYWAGIALKGGYDYKLNNGVTVQPNIYAGYTFVNNEDYTSKSGAKIKNDNLHLFEVAPGLKVSKDFENGWNTFAQAKYAFVMDNGGDANIGNVTLPNISADDYVEYGVGVDKELNDSWNMSVSANRRDGGREGWNGNISFQYNF